MSAPGVRVQRKDHRVCDFFGLQLVRFAAAFAVASPIPLEAPVLKNVLVIALSFLGVHQQTRDWRKRSIATDRARRGHISRYWGQILDYPKPMGSPIPVDKWGGDPTIEADQK